MKELTEEQFVRKLKKLLTKEIPKGLRVVYDSHQLRLFVIRDGYNFVDKDAELFKKGYIDITMEAVMDGDY